jgi:hypothetical protein
MLCSSEHALDERGDGWYADRRLFGRANTSVFVPCTPIDYNAVCFLLLEETASSAASTSCSAAYRQYARHYRRRRHRRHRRHRRRHRRHRRRKRRRRRHHHHHRRHRKHADANAAAAAGIVAIASGATAAAMPPLPSPPSQPRGQDHRLCSCGSASTVASRSEVSRQPCPLQQLSRASAIHTNNDNTVRKLYRRSQHRRSRKTAILFFSDTGFLAVSGMPPVAQHRRFARLHRAALYQGPAVRQKHVRD